MTSFSASKRPTHTSLDALLRTMQMSTIRIFVFVEGGEYDPFFYGSLCQTTCSLSGILYKVWTSGQIPNHSFGKQGLIAFFEYLDTRHSLISDFMDKKTAVIFFFDKDIDDILNCRIESEHAVYTSFYEVENHILREGDIKLGCAAAACMDPQEMEVVLNDQSEFLAEAAQKWKEWVKFCVFARVHELRGIVNYSQVSKINKDLTGELVDSEYQRYVGSLKSASGLTDTKFTEEFAQISKLVDDLYDMGEQDKVYKGKWYRYFLAEKIRSHHAAGAGSVKRIEEVVIRHIAGSLNFNGTWAEHFTAPVRKIVTKLIT